MVRRILDLVVVVMVLGALFVLFVFGMVLADIIAFNVLPHHFHYRGYLT